ncbi:MAG TPA: FeoA family protein [Synergistaceae bacterium]|nr:FeoA family protein [Synergistaceae bacterium]
MRTLREVEEGKTVEIARLSQYAPFAQRLYGMGLFPGSRITVQKKTCHSVFLRYGKQIVSLEHPWDTKIYVHAGQKEKKGSHA